MAYTVRTSKEDEKQIEVAKRFLSEKSATKAMIKCCELVPRQAEQIKQLLNRLQDTERKLTFLIEMTNDKLNIEEKIKSFLAHLESDDCN